MNVIDAILTRRSCRSFQQGIKLDPKTEVPLFEAACRTPSAGGIFPLTIRSTSKPAELAHAAHQPWIADASLAIVILADYAKIQQKYHSRGRQYDLLEAGHAAQNICLAATELGLGSCCVGAFRESKVLKALGLENSGLTPVYMVVAGREKENSEFSS